MGLIKKGGKVRVCVDYRKLNKMTIQNPYPIPNMDELRDTLGDAKKFTALYLKMEYHQIKIRRLSTYKTAFITRDGKFEYTRMPFGLINAPYTFQRTINAVFKYFIHKFCVIFLVDILIYSKNIEIHHSHIKLVLKRLKRTNLKLNYEKCIFGHDRIKFLGVEISNGVLEISKEQLDKIENLAIPKSIKELRKLFGFLGVSGNLCLLMLKSYIH